jgi:hypothetical protein
MAQSSFGPWVHDYAPHSAVALYAAAALSAAFFLAAIYGYCLCTGSTKHLDEKWIFQTATAAAPIPTYMLLLVVPFDPDLARTVLDDRVVVALGGLYGLVETLKDIRATAERARKSKNGQGAEAHNY